MSDGDTLKASAQTILDGLPCSVTLPAGTGKTELIAAACADIASAERSALVLTHTHAGVDAIRARLAKFRVPRGHITVRTIDSWCFDLVRSFPQLSGTAVADEPDWKQSRVYHRAAASAATSAAVQRMLRCSYQVVFVDEYQDCTIDQHAVVVEVARAVPTAVLGDPMQALFNFRGQPSVNWVTDVIPNFPDARVDSQPWRWNSTNPALGAWLLNVRACLSAGKDLDLNGAPITWIPSGAPTAQSTACFEAPKIGTVAALGRQRRDCVSVASRLAGTYAVMEALDEKVPAEFCAYVDTESPPKIAAATVEFAVSCATGIAQHVSPEKRAQLNAGKRIATRLPERFTAYDAVNELLHAPTPGNVGIALQTLVKLPGVKLFCRDAFHEASTALKYAELDPDINAETALSRTRGQNRHSGRRPLGRIVSRPRLAKGLEFDHVIILDADHYNAYELYVALTRGAHSVTVISASKLIHPLR